MDKNHLLREQLNCWPGQIALVVGEDAGCEANIGRHVRILHSLRESPWGAMWHIEPIGDPHWVVLGDADDPLTLDTCLDAAYISDRFLRTVQEVPEGEHKVVLPAFMQAHTPLIDDDQRPLIYFSESTKPESIVADRPERKKLECLHPFLMGGNYLPEMASDEVEIARVQIQSTTGGVMAVYARPGGDCIHYRLEDEYADERGGPVDTKTTADTMTLAQLGSFIFDAWLIDVLECNFSAANDLQRALDFFHARSDFYPDLHAWCRQYATEQLGARLAWEGEGR